MKSDAVAYILVLVMFSFIVFVLSASYQHDVEVQSFNDLCEHDGGIPIQGYCFSPDALLADPD